MNNTEAIKLILIERIKPGRAQAITGRKLAAGLGYKDDRVIRQCISDLIENGYSIASATEAPAGYYLAVTKQEVQEYAQSLRERLIKDALRRRGFLRASRAILHPGQLPLEV